MKKRKSKEKMRRKSKENKWKVNKKKRKMRRKNKKWEEMKNGNER